jgi:HTH-type transcriptional regulator / antitoxin HigA
MKNTLQPARLIPPGRILELELEARGWTQSQLAMVLGRPKQMVNEIINAKKRITPITALELAAALDIPAEFWMNLENLYRLRLNQKSVDLTPIVVRRETLEKTLYI